MKKIYLLLVAIIIVALVWVVARRKPEITERPKTAQEYFESGVNSYEKAYILSKGYRKMSPEEKEECNKLLISLTDSAIKSYQEVIDKYPDSEWTDDAQFCIAVGCYTKAVASTSNVSYIDKAIEANQKFIINYPEAKLEPQTREDLSFAIPKTVSSPHALAQWQIADIYQAIKKDYPQALIEFNKIIDKYPQDKCAHLAIWEIDRLCPKLNDYTPAIEACQKLLKTRTNITPGETVYFKKIIKESKTKQAALKKQG